MIHKFNMKNGVKVYEDVKNYERKVPFYNWLETDNEDEMPY
jgi:hypothetical protein